VLVAATLGEVSHGLEEIGRHWVWEMDAAMRHLDHGVGEEGVKRRLRFPGRSGRQGPQDHGDVERSDALDRTGMEGRADYAQPAFARMVILGVLVWLGDLGEIEVDRAGKGEDVGLSLGLQAGPASAGGVFALVDGAQGVLGLLGRAGKPAGSLDAISCPPESWKGRSDPTSRRSTTIQNPSAGPNPPTIFSPP
jgi:hypothetical protein